MPIVNNQSMFDSRKYPILARATTKLAYNANDLLDRENTLESIRAVLHKTEMSNVLLMGEAGQGKTAVMQEFARRYANNYLVLTTSIPQLTNDQTGNVSTNFKELFDEISKYRNDKASGDERQIVLFIDEFHVLPKESPAAVEDLKPEFARSSQLGIYLVGATTYQEYHDDIEPNEAFKQRFDIVKLPMTDDALTYKILKNRMAKQYSDYVTQTGATDKILKEIIQYSDLYIKDSEQPRKATNILDEMIGWVRIGQKFNHNLLVKLFALNKNIRLDLQTDASKLKAYLKSRVYDQPTAIEAMLRSAYASILNLNNPNKPRSVALFIGSTGVGKTELAKAFTQGMFGPDSRLTTFDMSEYKGQNAVQRFRYNLTDKVLSAPTPVILLDEVDRCDADVDELLFSVFDEARLHDRNGREVNFSNIFFILTTNKGEKIFEEVSNRGESTNMMTKTIDDLNRLIRKNLSNTPEFPAPLLSRVSDFVPFVPLSSSTNIAIVKRELERIKRDCMDKQNVNIRYDMDSLIKYVTQEKVDENSQAGGARQVVNIVNKDILASIAQYIIENPGKMDIYVTTIGQGRSDDKHHARSDMRIEVKEPSADVLERAYKLSVEKYRDQVVKMLKMYMKEDKYIQLPTTLNDDVFLALAHNGTDLPPKKAVNKLFAPLHDYFEEINTWDNTYSDPSSAPSPRPTVHIRIEFKNNEMQVVPLK